MQSADNSSQDVYNKELRPYRGDKERSIGRNGYFLGTGHPEWIVLSVGFGEEIRKTMIFHHVNS